MTTNITNITNIKINISSSSRVEQVLSLNVVSNITKEGVRELIQLLRFMGFYFRGDFDITPAVMWTSQDISKKFGEAVTIEDARACPISVAQDFYDWFSECEFDITVTIQDVNNPSSRVIARTDDQGVFNLRISDTDSLDVLTEVLRSI